MNSIQFKRWFGDWESEKRRSSKVRNDDGTPKIVYHGTNKEFQVFRSKDGAYWFSESEDYAESMAEERGGDRVMSVYLNMRNPYYAKLAPGQFSDPSAEAPILHAAKQGNYDGVIIEVDTNNELEKDTFYIVFEPTQIKSATDNVGLFDRNNENINYSLVVSRSKAAESLSLELASIRDEGARRKKKGQAPDRLLHAAVNQFGETEEANAQPNNIISGNGAKSNTQT